MIDAIDVTGGLALFAWRRKARWSRWVALVAAYVLVLQATFAGLATSTMAGSLSFDRVLAVTLCASGSSDVAGNSDHGPAKSHADQSCCTAGCPMLAADAPPRAIHRVVVHRPADLIAFKRRHDTPAGFVSGRSPANPRAPPVPV